MNDINWKKRASSIIKAELAKKDMSYENLVNKLAEIGISETTGNIATKLNRGTFSFIFVMQVFEALNIDTIDLKGV